MDTREKTPWSFRSQKSECLKYGDYSIQKGMSKIVIERKSLVDLFITLSPNRVEKFFDKMNRAVNTLEHVFIFIEASLPEICRGIQHSRIPGEYILRKLTELSAIGVHVYFTGSNRAFGKKLAEMVLRQLG